MPAANESVLAQVLHARTALRRAVGERDERLWPTWALEADRALCLAVSALDRGLIDLDIAAAELDEARVLLTGQHLAVIADLIVEAIDAVQAELDDAWVWESEVGAIAGWAS